jgi:16S rRNA G966 N2-methylase RsmD
MHVVRGDALRYIDTVATSYDIVFADPPYDLPGFGDIPEKVLKSKLLRPGSIFIIEHSRNYDFSQLPHFVEHRAYGSVNFSIFRIDE